MVPSADFATAPSGAHNAFATEVVPLLTLGVGVGVGVAISLNWGVMKSNRLELPTIVFPSFRVSIK